ncbi:MAG: BlaI/MecI/CopY family transcriptional regulator [Candidatus Latescibacteria bacterium]|nr:BlaI/MecI/CopY family transcriptional regulator [Candidatus Latescibacterota bacterium]
MARRISNTLTEVELEFMQILWSHKEAAPEDIKQALNVKGRTLTGGSIRKMLLILMKKEYVERIKEGKKYIYRAKVKQTNAKKSMILELLDRAFGGSAFQMFATLLESSEVPEEDIKKIEKLIGERKKEENR